MLLVGTAFAVESFSQGTLADQAKTLARLNQGGVAYVAANEGDRAAIASALAARALPPFPLVLADPALPDALARATAAATSANVRCVLILASPVTGLWTVDAFGECAGAFTAAPLPAPAGAPAAASPATPSTTPAPK